MGAESRVTGVRRPAPTRVRLPRALVLPLLVALLAGCATIPTGGPVKQGRELGADKDTQPRNIGFAPVRGASPDAVVRGFLRAMSDFIDDHAVARRFLTGPASRGWAPLSGTTVYDRRPGLTVESRADGAVAFAATEVARIDADGHYHRVPAGSVVRRTFGMARVAGQWRIAEAPEGLLLSTSDVDVAYQRVNLYFLAPTATLVVPDPVLLPNLPGLPTKIVARLLRGPTTDLRGAVDTAFPSGTGLEVSSVPVRDGLATVSLNSAALQADSDARTGMSAQLVWTLKQLSGIQRIRILADGDDLVTTGVPSEQPISAWSGFDPDAVVPDVGFLFSRDGRLLNMQGGTVRGTVGTASAPGSDLRLPVQSLDQRQYAAVTADRTKLVTMPQNGSGPPVVSPPMGLLSSPSWDRGGNLWTVDQLAGRLLLEADPGATISTVTVSSPVAGSLTAARVSRDGSRIALVTGSGAAARLYIGAIVRNPSGSVEGVSGVSAPRFDLTDVRSVAWNDAGRVTALARYQDGPLTAVLVDVDGFSVDEGVAPQQGLVAVASAPGRPLIGATSAGALLQWDPSGVGWQSLTRGRDPAYPG
jgi:hypothetical protein